MNSDSKKHHYQPYGFGVSFDGGDRMVGYGVDGKWQPPPIESLAPLDMTQAQAPVNGESNHNQAAHATIGENLGQLQQNSEFIEGIAGILANSSALNGRVKLNENGNLNAAPKPKGAQQNEPEGAQHNHPETAQKDQPQGGQQNNSPANSSQSENIKDGESEAADAPAPQDQAEEMLFSVDDLHQVQQDGYNQGYEDGLAAGQEKAKEITEALHNELLERLISEISSKAKYHQQALDQITGLSLKIFRQSLAKLLPVTLQRKGGDEILAVYQEVLNHLSEATKLRISFHPDHEKEIRASLMKMTKKNPIETQVKIMVDDALQHGDVEIDWGNGGYDHHMQVIMDQIDDAVALIEQNIPTYSELNPIPDDGDGNIDEDMDDRADGGAGGGAGGDANEAALEQQDILTKSE